MSNITQVCLDGLSCNKEKHNEITLRDLNRKEVEKVSRSLQPKNCYFLTLKTYNMPLCICNVTHLQVTNLFFLENNTR